MGKLAQRLSGQSQSQIQTKKKGGVIESREPKSEERREAKLSPKARAAVEKAEAFKCGGSVNKGKK